MKTNSKTSLRSRQIYVYQPPVPNAAPPSYFTEVNPIPAKAAVSAMGFVAAMVFLVVMA